MGDIYKIILILALFLIPQFTETRVVNLTPKGIRPLEGVLEEGARIPKDSMLLEGEVIGREGDLLVINLGEKDKVKKDMRLFVYKITGLERDEAKNIIGMKRIPIGVVKIEKVKGETSIGSIERSSSPIEIGDIVGR